MSSHKNIKPGASAQLAKPQLPKSCTSMWINLCGVVGFFVALYLLRSFQSLAEVYKVMIAMSGYIVPIAVLECIFLRTYRKPSTGYDFSARQPFERNRVLIKLFGFYFTLLLLGFAYSFFPEYEGGVFGYLFDRKNHDESFYIAYWEFLRIVMPYILIGAIPYFIYMERYSQKSEDGYWQTGLILMLRWTEIDGKRLGQHMLGWLVKGFFLPLMYVYFAGTVIYFTSVNLQQVATTPELWFGFFWEFFYGIDLVIVTVGYILAIRLLDSHIRSAEPTFSGWFWALICYQPIWAFVNEHYLTYDNDGLEWVGWLSDYPVMQGIWGFGIMVLTFVYAFASVSFGLRFSNLTNRGILTNGAYRYTKHPAYVSKNLSWWMIAVPFVLHAEISVGAMLLSCLGLLSVNFIYFMRARTEERHLSSDPVYVEYALAMNERSMFSWLGKLIPALQYRPSAKLVDIE